MKHAAMAALIIALAVLAGCAESGYNTQKGAAIGAAGGAIAGQVMGRDTASTLIGAGAGALVGAITGNAVDQHVQKQQGQGGQATAYPSGQAQQDPPAGGSRCPAAGRAGNGSPRTR